MSTPAKAKVLVADDEAVIRELLEKILTEEGYQVIAAADGQETVNKAIAEKPDLILLDILMPKFDGMEVCKRLRANAQTRNVRIIILTAFNTRDRLEDSIAAGADDFLGKPIDLLELKVRVRSMLKVKNISDQVERLLEYIKSMGAMRGEKPPQ
jgi:DNA-binding response OmpR family regulator